MRGYLDVRLDDSPIRALIKNLPRRSVGFVAARAEGVLRRIRAKAPRRTGALARNIEITTPHGARYSKTVEVRESYAPYVEFGARGRLGRYFLTEAVNEEARDAERLLPDLFRDAR